MNLKKVLFIFAFCSFFNLGAKEMKNQTLSERQRDIVLIASNTAKGNIDELKKNLIKSLNDNTLTVNEIKEILVQMYAYCGFPRSLNGINAFIEVINERETAGIDDEIGEEGESLSENYDKNKYGEDVRAKLVGSRQTGAYAKFVPVIDDYLKEHLFADIFARGVLTYQEREIATIAALSAREGVEAQRNAHVRIGKNTGLTPNQIKEIVTTSLNGSFKNTIFERGTKNDAYAKYFIGQSYLKSLNTEGVNIANVTFEPRCRNNWHIHHKGGQILLVTQGRGWYQEWGKPAQELHPGDVVYIAPELKHWHGAAKDSWFVHIALAVPAEGATNEWLEPVTDEEYNKLR